MAQRRRDRRPRLPHDVRAEIVEEEVDGAVICRERREDVAAPGEAEEREAVARAAGAQAPHFLLHSFEAAGALVVREHRERKIKRDGDVYALDLQRLRGTPPARARQRDTQRQRRRSQTPGPCGRHERSLRRGQARQRLGRTVAQQSRTPTRVPQPHQRERQHRDGNGGQQAPRPVHETHHGNGPRRQSRPNSSSNANIAMPSGHRYQSRNRTRRASRIGARSSASMR